MSGARQAGPLLVAALRDPVLATVAVLTSLLAVWFVLAPAGVDALVMMYWVPQPLLDLLLVSSASCCCSGGCCAIDATVLALAG